MSDMFAGMPQPFDIEGRPIPFEFFDSRQRYAMNDGNLQPYPTDLNPFVPIAAPLTETIAEYQMRQQAAQHSQMRLARMRTLGELAQTRTAKGTSNHRTPQQKAYMQRVGQLSYYADLYEEDRLMMSPNALTNSRICLESEQLMFGHIQLLARVFRQNYYGLSASYTERSKKLAEEELAKLKDHYYVGLASMSNLDGKANTCMIPQRNGTVFYNADESLVAKYPGTTYRDPSIDARRRTNLLTIYLGDILAIDSPTTLAKAPFMDYKDYWLKWYSSDETLNDEEVARVGKYGGFVLRQLQEGKGRTDVLGRSQIVIGEQHVEYLAKLRNWVQRLRPVSNELGLALIGLVLALESSGNNEDKLISMHEVDRLYGLRSRTTTLARTEKYMNAFDRYSTSSTYRYVDASPYLSEVSGNRKARNSILQVATDIKAAAERYTLLRQLGAACKANLTATSTATLLDSTKQIAALIDDRSKKNGNNKHLIEFFVENYGISPGEYSELIANAEQIRQILGEEESSVHLEAILQLKSTQTFTEYTRVIERQNYTRAQLAHSRDMSRTLSFFSVSLNETLVSGSRTSAIMHILDHLYDWTTTNNETDDSLALKPKRHIRLKDDLEYRQLISSKLSTYYWDVIIPSIGGKAFRTFAKHAPLHMIKNALQRRTSNDETVGYYASIALYIINNLSVPKRPDA